MLECIGSIIEFGSCMQIIQKLKSVEFDISFSVCPLHLRCSADEIKVLKYETHPFNGEKKKNTI